MMGYICHYAVTHKQEMFDNSYNAHQAQTAKQTVRGTIYANDGRVLAYTEVAEDGKEKRIYPYDNMFAHVVGYSTKGKAGIEKMANYYLVNSSVSINEKVDFEYNGEKYPGDDVFTTLDADLQKIAYDSLGVYRGAVVVTEPSTGRILAMVSKPDYNPGNIANDWETLINDKQSSVLLNRAAQGLYPPGSTFKIITALEYIRENPETYNQYSYQCTGSFTKDGNKINCYHGSVHKTVDFKKSFAKSCNSSFANIGTMLDKEKFAETLSSLMFNDELPIDLPYKKSMAKVSKDTEIGDIMQTSIGQGTDAMTPLHLNMITCAIANNGVLNKPYLLDRVENHNGQIIKKFALGKPKELLTTTESNIMKDLMAEVVESGTGTKLSGLSFTAAGKTGSAEYSSVKEDSHAWFTGFAPVEDPKICVTVIIEGAGSGGDYAVPVAKRIMEEYLTR